jgi:hypothetical protein
VRNMGMIAMLVALVLGGVATTQAQDTRLAAFALNCFVPPTHGLHTHAVLVGKIKFTHRTIRFVSRCFDSPSASRFPNMQMSDGQVQAVDVSVVTSLETSTRQVVAQNHCSAHGKNGFLTFRCMASEAHGGEVDILVSIAPLHLQVSSEGATP